MKRLFKKLFKRQTPPVEVAPFTVPPQSSGILAYRQSPSLVSEARSTLESAPVVRMVAAIEQDHPGKFILPATTQPHVRAAVQSCAEGYSLALMRLKSLGRPFTKSELSEPTFEPEEKE